MHLQESGEMYLESIHVLLHQRGQVRAVDVSEYMGYSKPSVSRAIGLLREGGYLTVAEDACRIEHVISDESFLALKRSLGLPDEDVLWAEL